MSIYDSRDTREEGFYIYNRSIFQLSDIEKWMARDTDQNMLHLDVLLVNAAAHRFSRYSDVKH